VLLYLEKIPAAQKSGLKRLRGEAGE